MLNEVKETMLIINGKNSHWRYRKYKKNQMEIPELENTISEINLLARLNGRK